MFVRNRSKLSPVLAKGHFARDLAALSLCFDVVFDIRPDGTLERVDDGERGDADPPDVRGRVLWHGTSVTAFATVDAPPKPPFARTVRLSVADRVVDLAVYGSRRWGRRLGQWVQSEPERFERLPLDWTRAFGGTLALEPHLTRAGLPHPGGVVAYGLNPRGRGLTVEGAPMDGALLPNIEHPRALLAAPGELVVPHGFAPCPELLGLRTTDVSFASDARPMPETVLALWPRLRMLHHAPGWLVFDAPLESGTPIALIGHGERHLRVLIPSCPARVAVRAGRRPDALVPRVRSVHIDGDREQLTVTWGHTSKYHPRRAPQWIELEAA